METFRLTDLEVVLPCLGVTVTVTLQLPTLTPVNDVPETLQYFAEDVATFRDSFEVDDTVSFA